MKTISRRAMLRGAGAALALPLLESMSSAKQEPRPPVRLCLYVVGGGAYLPYWTMDDSGRRAELSPQKSVEFLGAAVERNEALTQLPPSLEPLDPVKEHVLVLGGLTLANAFGFEDGHSAEVGALLTGVIFARDQVQCGISVDQLAARHLEGKTYLDSLVVGLQGPRPGGAKGVGRVYAQHYSWRSASTPTGEERNPKLVFDRLFRRKDRAAGSTEADRRSVLDSVREEARRLQASVGGADRNKLEEYLTAVRDVEKRIEYASKQKPDPKAPAFDLGGLKDEVTGVEQRLPAEKGIPESYVDYDRLMVDLIALAFQTDATRVAVLTHGGYRSYPEAEVKRGHHDCQHHEGAPEKREDLRRIDRFNAERFGDAVRKFASIREGAGTLLDNSMLLFASGMSNGNRHSRENLPIVLAGRGGGTIKPGRYVDYNWKKYTPVANLYVELLRRLGAPAAQFGDSTGGLPHLA